MARPVVEAVRDDGARMVTKGQAAAVVLPGGAEITYLPKDSVYARGGWIDAPAGMKVPAEVDEARLDEVHERVAGALRG
jgi:hypothetical protein